MHLCPCVSLSRPSLFRPSPFFLSRSSVSIIFPSGRDFKCRNEGEDAAYETSRQNNLESPPRDRDRPSTAGRYSYSSDESNSFRLFLGHPNPKFKIFYLAGPGETKRHRRGYQLVGSLWPGGPLRSPRVFFLRASLRSPVLLVLVSLSIPPCVLRCPWPLVSLGSYSSTVIVQL
jgi:hypothetical protein